MNVKALLLRRNGVLLTLPPTSEWAKLPKNQWLEGIMETGIAHGKGRNTKCLLIRDFKSSPGRGIFCELYSPTVVHVMSEHMVFRGFEPVDSSEGVALHVQEWAVFTNT